MCNAKLTKKAIIRYILPSVIALMGTRIGNLIDHILLGKALGSDGLAMLSIFSPVELIFLSLGALIGVGLSVAAGSDFANGSKEKLNQAYSSAMIYGLAISVSLSVIGFVFSAPLSAFLGADASLLKMTSDYLKIFIISAPFLVLMFIPLYIFKLAGEPSVYMKMLIIMGGLKTVLSLIFTVLLGKGLYGVAVATAISQITACLYGFAKMRRGKIVLLRRHFSVYEMFMQMRKGSPAALDGTCRAIKIALINILIVHFALRDMLAAYSVANNVNSFVLAFTNAIPQAALPLIIAAYGQKDFNAVRHIIRQILYIGNVIAAICAIAVFCASRYLTMLYGIDAKNAELTHQTIAALTFLLLSFNLQMINNLLFNHFTAIRKAIPAILVTLTNDGLFVALSALFLTLGAGISGVWWSFVASEAITVLAMLGVANIYHLRNRNLSRVLLLDNAVLKNLSQINLEILSDDEQFEAAKKEILKFGNAVALSAHQLTVIDEFIKNIPHFVLDMGGNCLMELRVISSEAGLTLHLRHGGKWFNPVSNEKNSAAYLAVNKLTRLNADVEYNRAMGLNNLLVKA